MKTFNELTPEEQDAAVEHEINCLLESPSYIRSQSGSVSRGCYLKLGNLHID